MNDFIMFLGMLMRESPAQGSEVAEPAIVVFPPFWSALRELEQAEGSDNQGCHITFKAGKENTQQRKKN